MGVVRPIGFPTILCAVVLGAAVSAVRAGVIRHDREQGSYLDLGARPEYAGVGKLGVDRNGMTGFIGSATLVAPEWVLTAAHVVDDATSVSFSVNGRDYAASHWVSHPKWDRGSIRRGYDLALVRLGEPVADVAPAKLYKGRQEFGQAATFVGVGKTGNGNTGVVDPHDGRKRAGRNVIDGQPGKVERTFESRLKGNARIFLVDFDNPDRPGANALGSPTPDDLEMLISHGDSGGPVFLDTPQGQLLAGVHSYGEPLGTADDSGYGDVTGHTRVSPFAAWIRKSMRRRGIPPATPTFLAPRLEANDSLTGPGDFGARALSMNGGLSPTLMGLETGAGGSVLPHGAAGVVPEPGGSLTLLVLAAVVAGRRRRA